MCSVGVIEEFKVKAGLHERSTLMFAGEIVICSLSGEQAEEIKKVQDCNYFE